MPNKAQLAGGASRTAKETLLALLPELAVLVVLSAVVRLARIASLGFVGHAKRRLVATWREPGR